MLVSQQFSAFTLPTQLYFYLCMAILVSDFKTERVETRRWRPFQWVLALPLACAALYLAAGDVLLASARRELDRGDVESAVRSLDRARAWGASADVYFSRRFLAFSQASSDTGTRFRAWQYAMDAAARAPNTAEDRQNALRQTGSSHTGCWRKCWRATDTRSKPRPRRVPRSSETVKRTPK